MSCATDSTLGSYVVSRFATRGPSVDANFVPSPTKKITSWRLINSSGSSSFHAGDATSSSNEEGEHE